METGLQKAIDDLENSKSIDREEALELAKAVTDHWISDNSEDASRNKVLMIKKNNKQSHSLYPCHPVTYY